MSKPMGGMFTTVLAEKLEEKPDFPVLTFENGVNPKEVLTYKDIFDNGFRVARALAKQGISQGDTLAVLMRNRPEIVYTQLAASMIGATMMPIDPRSRPEKLAYQITDSGAKWIIFSNEVVPQVEAVLESLP
ncbi:MAG: AMP-binding protein [Chloroflexota bacterium]